MGTGEPTQAKSDSKQDRRERALRERQAQITAEKEKMAETIDRTRAGANREEAEQTFM
jgi:hypothetical protein